MRAQFSAPTLERAKELRAAILAFGWVPFYDPMEMHLHVRCWRRPPIVIPPELVVLVEELERPAAASAFIKLMRAECL